MAKKPRVIVLTTEAPPLAGLATTGAGLRAWALAQGLQSAGHDDVTLLVTADAFAKQGGKVPPVPTGCPAVKSVTRADLQEWLTSHQPDVLVAQHWGILRQIDSIQCPLAIDLAGPHLLERRLWGSSDPEADRREKQEALARADHVVCSGRAQRHYFIPYLLEAGFEAEPSLCPIIPFSMSPDLPTPPEDRDHAAVAFCGFFLPWQDPELPLRWLLEECEQREKGTLVFFGGPHPTLDVSRGKSESLMDFIENHPRAQNHGVLPFGQMIVKLRQCGLALDLMPQNLERELAFPSRTVVYMWAGLPVIHNNYDDLAPLIEKYRAGWTRDPKDQKGFSRLVGRLLGHHEDAQRRSAGARKLVQERLTWDKTIHPLSEWTLDPQPRAKKAFAAFEKTETSHEQQRQTGPSTAISSDQQEKLRRAEAENARLRAEIKTLRSRRVTQIRQKARGISPILAPVAFALAALGSVVLFILFTIADTIGKLTGGSKSPNRG